jgi:endonuclease/exonuclease/phosphatase (EEP) superfamily protein YafD
MGSRKVSVAARKRPARGSAKGGRGGRSGGGGRRSPLRVVMVPYLVDLFQSMVVSPTDAALWAAVLGALLVTLVGFAAPLFWGFALFEHFRLQYVVSALVLAAAALATRRPFHAIVAGVVVLFNLAAIAPLWLQPELPEHHGAPLEVLELNVQQDNPDHARVAKLLAASDADVVGLIEVDRLWLRDLAPALTKWPYRLEQPHEKDKFGMALYSKRPFRFRVARTFGEWPVAITATIAMDDAPVTLALIHPPPAVRGESAALQRKFYEALAKERPSLGEHVVVFGDFNAAPWSYALRHLRSVTGLNDQRRGFDLGLSWPAKLVPWRIPIDQVLVSPRVVVLSRHVGDAVGSDHFPVTTEVALVK